LSAQNLGEKQRNNNYSADRRESHFWVKHTM
jgi:hypothetical protein